MRLRLLSLFASLCVTICCVTAVSAQFGSTRGISLAILLAALTGYASAAPPSDGTPYLDKSGTLTDLVVDGKPFLILGGELRNSSTSSLEYMKPIWPRMAAERFNTLLAVATWQQIEPLEGKFDYSYVDAAIAGAQESHLHLVILWFGRRMERLPIHLRGSRRI